jgi:hypothetical protein
VGKTEFKIKAKAVIEKEFEDGYIHEATLLHKSVNSLRGYVEAGIEVFGEKSDTISYNMYIKMESEKFKSLKFYANIFCGGERR